MRKAFRTVGLGGGKGKGAGLQARGTRRVPHPVLIGHAAFCAIARRVLIDCWVCRLAVGHRLLGLQARRGRAARRVQRARGRTSPRSRSGARGRRARTTPRSSPRSSRRPVAGASCAPPRPPPRLRAQVPQAGCSEAGCSRTPPRAPPRRRPRARRCRRCRAAAAAAAAAAAQGAPIRSSGTRSAAPTRCGSRGAVRRVPTPPLVGTLFIYLFIFHYEQDSLLAPP